KVRPLMARPRHLAPRGAPRREQPTPSRIVGIFRQYANENRIEPTDKRARAEWVVPRGHEGGAKPGEIVLAAPLPAPRFGLKPARVIERLGSMGDARSVSLVVITSHDIPTEFSAEALAEAAHACGVGVRGRTDLRDI